MFAQLLFHPSSTKHPVLHPVTKSVPIKYCYLRQPIILLLEQPPSCPFQQKSRWQLKSWLLWRLSGQFTKQNLAQEHCMPLKSTLPKESQIWLIGKETAGGVWWPPSEITISCLPLKTIYHCQGCHRNCSSFLSQFSLVLPLFSLSPSQGLDFP